MKDLNYIFFGTTKEAASVLRALTASGYRPSIVVTTPDAPAGRDATLTPSPVATLAKELGLNLARPTSLKKDPAFVEQLQDLHPGFGVVVAYGKIIPDSVIAIPQLGILNIHPSLLPKYRGPTPVQTTILNGDTEAGVSIIKIDADMDHGPIIAQEKYRSDSLPSFEELSQTLFEQGTRLLLKILPDYLSGKITPQAQDDAKASYTKIFDLEDAEIQPTEEPKIACNKIRALNPEPGTYMVLDINGKKQRLKILEADFKDGSLTFKTVQLEGGKPMSGQAFINGYGTKLDLETRRLF